MREQTLIGNPTQGAPAFTPAAQEFFLCAETPQMDLMLQRLRFQHPK